MKRLLKLSGVLSILGAVLIQTSSVNALAFIPNNLMDSAIFDNHSSMNETQIDAFLNTFPSSCISTNNGFSAPDVIGYNPTDRFKYSTTTTVSAGKVIGHAAEAYGINPQVLLATLQKEQSLVTGSAGCYPNEPDPSWQLAGSPASNSTFYWASRCSQTGSITSTLCTKACTHSGGCMNIAVGYDCPYYCKTSSEGFSKQIIKATWSLKFHEQRSVGNVSWNVQKTTTVDASGNPWVSAWDNSDDPPTPFSSFMTQGTFSLYQGGPAVPFDGYTPVPGISDLSGSAISLHMDTGPTAALYAYTPFESGNQSFVNIFTGWFGSPYAFIYNGVRYSAIFDPVYYLSSYPDIQQATGGDQLAAFNHFIYYGMKEGRQGGPNFNVTSYRNRYPDLRWAFGDNLPAYYVHYLTNGQFEGRTAIGAATLQPVSSFKGVDYSSVYDFSTYLAINSDLNSKYSTDDTSALLHFINFGMNEGRQASVFYNVQSYQASYYDLRRVFGNNLKAYYMHFITNGKAEGRTATGSYLGGTTTQNGIDYSAVYNVNDYENYNSDIKKTYALDDIAALNHFVNYGMNEGRQASSTFNVYTYKARYPDLQVAFGNNLKAYYMHFITNGKAEGRSGI